MSNRGLKIIFDCYLSDPEHIEKDHIEAGKGIDVCAKSTFDVLENDGAIINEVERDGKVIGYFSSAVFDGLNIMQFWFIKPEYRNSENVLYFWGIVSNYFGGLYYTSLYEKNKKAIKHLEKQGFKAVNNLEEKIFMKCQ